MEINKPLLKLLITSISVGIILLEIIKMIFMDYYEILNIIVIGPLFGLLILFTQIEKKPGYYILTGLTGIYFFGAALRTLDFFLNGFKIDALFNSIAGFIFCFIGYKLAKRYKELIILKVDGNSSNNQYNNI